MDLDPATPSSKDQCSSISRVGRVFPYVVIQRHVLRHR